MSSVFVELSGGLGNQLFQASAAIATAKLSGGQAFAYPGRHFAKSSHGNSIEDLDWHGQLKFRHPNGLEQAYHALRFRKSRLLSGRWEGPRRYLWQTSDNWSLPPVHNKPLFMRGYFQNSDFTELNDNFIPPSLKKPSASYREAARQALLTGPIGIHVRRGDYKKHKHTHGILSSDYYSSAIAAVDPNSTTRSGWVFSDDDPAAMRVIGETGLMGNLIPASDFGLNDLETMLLLSECKDLILGNSTFSLWAGLLSKSAFRIVRPNPPFVGISPHSNFFPQRFQKVASGWETD